MNRELVTDIIETLDKKSVKLGKEKEGTTIFRLSSPRPFRGCVDCGGTVECYMVHDDLWHEAFYNKRELACIPCLEKRLQRSLKIEDFTTCLANVNLFRAYRMGLDAAEARHAVDRNREQESARPHLSYDAAIRGIEKQHLPYWRRTGL